MADTIQASFGMDTSPLQAAFAKAESIASAGAAKVAQAIKSGQAKAGAALAGGVPWNASQAQAGILARQRRNSAAGYASAPLGKYSSPEEQQAVAAGKSFRGQVGSGRILRALLALGGVTEVLSMIERAAEEVTKRRNAVAELTHGPGASGFQTGADAKSNLSGASSEIKEIRESGQFDSSSRFRSVIASARDFVTGDSKEEREGAKESLRKQASQDIDNMARSQDKLNEAEHESVFGSKEKAALLEEEAKNLEHLAELSKAEAMAGVNNPAARNAENQRYEQAKDAIKQETALKMIELGQEERLNAIGGESLTAEQKRLAVLKERLSTIDQLISQSASDAPTQQKLVNQKGALFNEQREAEFEAADMSPAAVKARNAAQLVANKHRAFNTNMDQAEDPSRAAYGGVVSGIGAVGNRGPSGATQMGDLKHSNYQEGGGGDYRELIQAMKEMKSEMRVLWGAPH